MCSSSERVPRGWGQSAAYRRQTSGKQNSACFYKAIENETEDGRLHVTGEYHCALTSAELHPLQKGGHKGTEWLSVKRHLMETFWLAEVIVEDMNCGGLWKRQMEDD